MNSQRHKRQVQVVKLAFDARQVLFIWQCTVSTLKRHSDGSCDLCRFSSCYDSNVSQHCSTAHATACTTTLSTTTVANYRSPTLPPSPGSPLPTQFSKCRACCFACSIETILCKSHASLLLSQCSLIELNAYMQAGRTYWSELDIELCQFVRSVCTYMMYRMSKTLVIGSI